MDPRLAALMGLAPRMAQPMQVPPNAMGVAQPQFPVTPYNPSLMEKLFPENGMEGLLGRDALSGMRRQGLLQMGLSLLGNSGQSLERRGLGELLAGGFQAGQQGYQGAFGGALQGQQVMVQLAQQKLHAERQQAFDQIAKKYKPVPGESAEDRRARMAGMISEFIAADPAGMGGKLNAFASVFDVPKDAATRNIDPRSPEGIAAEKELINYRSRLEASLRTEPKDKPLTEGERKAAVLLEIAGPSAAALDEFDAPSRLAQHAGGKGVGELTDAEQQALNTHSLAVADAYIRLTSGANAPEPEVQRAFQMIAPRSGDKPSTLKLKREMRQRMISALRLAARQETPRGKSAVKAADAAGSPPSPAAPARRPLVEYFK